MRASYEKVVPDDSRFFRIYRRLDPAFPFAWHYHREYELTSIVGSRGRRFVGDHIEDYADGDLVFLGPNLPHTWCSAPEETRAEHEAVVVQFSEEFIGPGNL